MLFQLGKQIQNFDQISEHLSSVNFVFFNLKVLRIDFKDNHQFSSIINHHSQELMIWFYTWFKLGRNIKIEQFLSNSIEKIILNPYPLVEKTIKDSG